ncbi:uncharacterized protein LOC117780000 isoform X2 [Drosophila innubila]|uniref:uncharacterized protein LOC117780000 isoform X2 n=1 Tax=Drosophila innubila TaxID=198719 RepID=UPI00148C7882|nr:uncharacterized protein LOC117780000 isoform X2 [Drosophila innubila]
MSTINRRRKVKFRNALEKCSNGDPAAICDQSALYKERAEIIFPSVKSSLMSIQDENNQSVLNELTKSSKKKAVKVANNNNNNRCNTQCNIILRHCSNIFATTVSTISLRSHFNMSLVLLIMLYLICTTQSILVEDQNQNPNIHIPGNAEDHLKGISASTYNTNTNTNTSVRYNVKPISSNATDNNGSGLGLSSISSSVASSGYLGDMDNLERSLAAVLIKVAYGTTSTTKRSIPDNSYILGLTTVATPLLTTLRYQSSHQPQNTGIWQRPYELDLERDHALPTSAPNADILKSNNNPGYPNPNRHHSSSNNDRDRHRHTMQYNSTPMPSFPNLLKKSPAKGGQPTVPMYPGDIPSYSPPSRSFFTPPLPPEYQNPFADKPTLRGTNNEGLVANTVTFNNRRPIPPPSLMPGHERIPFRPPDLTGTVGESNSNPNPNSNVSYPSSVVDTKKKAIDSAVDRKKALNTPSRSSSNDNHNDNANHNDNDDIVTEVADHKNHHLNENKSQQDLSGKRQEVLPNIRRILGSNGKKGDIPAVLLRQVTQRPIVSYHQPPASAIVSVENAEESSSSRSNDQDDNGAGASPNINKSKQSPGQMDYNDQQGSIGSRDRDRDQAQSAVTTPSAAAAIGEAAATSFTAATTTTYSSVPRKSAAGGGATAAAGGAGAATWTWAWNIHVYLSVVLFTILAVYSLYKLLTYNKLTHLFAQSYFVYIHLILISICIMRIFYLCFDAYNIHGTFNIFAAELLLNLPSTFLTVAFSVLILFLFLKSLNHKNNRYSALVRPLTVVVGCGVHVVLCITLHYVESYTLQNHHMYFQQQQQQQFFRRQQQQQSQQHQSQSQSLSQTAAASPSTSLANPPPPPRVLSLICQIIYIFICLSLGLLYLYLYRILKRILRSKSQNYIHGYQNLSYAIHITIATALLFVLLAALQIFGAVCISTARPLITQTIIVEVDWMQWGYQFSLRLIEISIITLISWVTGLKTNVAGNSNSNANAAINGDVHMIGQAAGVNGHGHGPPGGPGNGNSIREKHSGVGGGAHQNVANFFLPCTSGSSQEQFENDYPAICNANTNLHTYTMRTVGVGVGVGVGVAASPGGHRCTQEYQLQEPMYQRPYDTGSIRSAVNHNIATESQRLNYHHPHPHHHHQIMGLESAAYMSADYMTDATTDHYENPNFDLRASSTGAVAGSGSAPGSGSGPGVIIDAIESVAMQKLSKNTVSSGSASVSGSGCGSGSGSGSASGSGSSGTSQQQMLLLQSDSCYSEPLQENSSYEFNNFERPIFKEESHASDECWPDRERERDRDRDRDRERHKRSKCRDRDRKQNNGTLERAAYENPERRSSNSTNSCSSSNGVRYASYNSYERAANPHYNGVRKSGTLNNIVNGSTMGMGMGMGVGMGMGMGLGSGAGVAVGPRTGTIAGPGPGRALMQGNKRVNGAQTLASHYYQRSGRSAPSRALATNDFEMAATTTTSTLKQQQQQQQQHLQQQQQQQHYNHNNSDEEDEEEEDDDDMMSGSNVECTNLITSDPHLNPHPHPLGHHHHLQHVQTNKQHPLDPLDISTGNSAIVTEQGFLRFRANQDDDDDGIDSNNDQQLGAAIAVHKPSRSIPNALSQINSNKINNGIDC